MQVNHTHSIKDFKFHLKRNHLSYSSLFHTNNLFMTRSCNRRVVTFTSEMLGSSGVHKFQNNPENVSSLNVLRDTYSMIHFNRTCFYCICFYKIVVDKTLNPYSVFGKLLFYFLLLRLDSIIHR